MQNLAQMRFVTENYGALQGLRMIPFGLWFLIMAVGDLADIPALRQGRLDYPLLLMIAMGALYWLIGVYYAHTYGQVTPLPKNNRQKLLGNWPILLFAAGIALDWLLQLPVSFLAITLSIFFLVPLIKGGPPFRWHYVFIGLIMLVISLLPLFLNDSLKDKFFAPSGAYFLLGMGTALIVTGIIDHLWLHRFMKPVPEGA
ncbi:MAG: hypothetical protein P8183_04685 [Anaerolineae bacterium]